MAKPTVTMCVHLAAALSVKDGEERTVQIRGLSKPYDVPSTVRVEPDEDCALCATDASRMCDGPLMKFGGVLYCANPEHAHGRVT